MSQFFAVLSKYAVFTGRARRREYWMYYLFYCIFAIVAMIIDRVLGTDFGARSAGVFSLLLSLALFIPSLAVTVRRLHDTERSGAWIFIALVPLIGGIWLLVLLCTDGTRGDNRYGPDPKAHSGSF